MLDAKHPYRIYICNECGHEWSVQWQCNDRTCPRCQAIRRKRIIAVFGPQVLNMTNPWFFTLTLRRCLLTRRQVTGLRNSFTKLRHRKAWGKSRGFYQIEVGTLKPVISDLYDGRIQTGVFSANLHIHSLVDWRGDPLPNFDDDISRSEMKNTWLSKAWAKITGGSFVVYATPCWHPQHAVDFYLTRHMAKRVGEKWAADYINKVFRNTRLVQGFGWTQDERKEIMVAMDLEEANSYTLSCPECGSENVCCMDFTNEGRPL